MVHLSNKKPSNGHCTRFGHEYRLCASVEVVFNRAMSAAYGMESLEFIGGNLAIKE